METRGVPFYETVFIARPDISGPQVESLADAFTKVIEDQGGAIKKREHWGLRSLSYRIKKNRKGHYVLFNVDAPAPAVHELERQMRINEDILRYMTIRVDALEEGPSAIMQSRSGRDERGGGRREGRGGFREGFREGRGGDRPERSFGGDRPERSFGGDRPERSFGGDRPERSSGGDRPERSFGGDRPAEGGERRGGSRTESEGGDR